MKIGNWALLWLYKDYSILAIARVTKKLTQQYVDPFLIKESVGCLVYKLDIPPNWKIYPVFLIVQLELASTPSEYQFQRPQLIQLPSVYVNDIIDTYKLFEIEQFLNKRTVKRGRGHSLEYLVR